MYNSTQVKRNTNRSNKMNAKKYYAADNQYGSETSIGFANTWYVLAFSSHNARERYVDESEALSARRITRREIPIYVPDEPKPFLFEHYAISEIAQPIDGAIGEVTVSSESRPGYLERLNR